MTMFFTNETRMIQFDIGGTPSAGSAKDDCGTITGVDFRFRRFRKRPCNIAEGGFRSSAVCIYTLRYLRNPTQFNRINKFLIMTTQTKNQKLNSLLHKTKKAHLIYVGCSNKKKIELFNAFEVVFKELDDLGVNRDISEALLIGGKDFLIGIQPLVGEKETVEEIEAILDGKIEDLTEEEIKRFELARKKGFSQWRVLETIDGKVGIRGIC